MLQFPFNQFSDQRRQQGKTQGICYGLSIYTTALFKIEGTFLGYSAAMLENSAEDAEMTLFDWSQVEKIQNKTAYWLQTRGHFERPPQRQNNGWIVYLNPEARDQGPRARTNYTIESVIENLKNQLQAENSCTTLFLYPRNKISFTPHALTLMRQGKNYAVVDANHGLYLGSKKEFSRFMPLFLEKFYRETEWATYGFTDFKCRFKARLSYWDYIRSSFLFYLHLLSLSLCVMLFATVIVCLAFSGYIPLLTTAWCCILFCIFESLTNTVSKLWDLFSPRHAAPSIDRVLPQQQYTPTATPSHIPAFNTEKVTQPTQTGQGLDPISAPEARRKPQKKHSSKPASAHAAALPAFL